MSKIIIHNNSKMSDIAAVGRVKEVMELGFISGPKQYCWAISNHIYAVYAMKTQGNTHTFKVEDE